MECHQEDGGLEHVVYKERCEWGHGGGFSSLKKRRFWGILYEEDRARLYLEEHSRKMRGIGCRLEQGNFRTELYFFTRNVIKWGISILGDIQNLLDKFLRNLV